jgi:hypothetical protein
MSVTVSWRMGLFGDSTSGGSVDDMAQAATSWR